MTFEWFDIVGTIGVVIILVAYYLLQVERITIHGLFYSVTNLLGAIFITISLIYKFNFASFLIEICWIAISLVGIARYIKQRRKAPTTEEASR